MSTILFIIFIIGVFVAIAIGFQTLTTIKDEERKIEEEKLKEENRKLFSDRNREHRPFDEKEEEDKKSPGFTLMEMMVVVIILGIVAAFAIPSYNRALEKQHERDIIQKQYLIHSASMIYLAKYGELPPMSTVTLSELNQLLNLDIVLNGEGFYYNAPQGEHTFENYMYWLKDGTFRFGINLTSEPLGPNNPCCDADDGDCPTLPDCS